MFNILRKLPSCTVTISKYVLPENINDKVFMSHNVVIIVVTFKLSFLIFCQVEVNRVCRVQCFTEQAASSVYMDSRSITLRVTLDPGRYALLPTTFYPGFTGRFLLRLFSHTQVKLR